MMRKSTWAVRVGTGDLGVGRHPVVGVGRTLLGGQQRQDRRERIDREALARRQRQNLALELEIVAGARAAIDLRPGGHDRLDPQVPELEAFVGLVVRSSLSASGAWAPVSEIKKAKPIPAPRAPSEVRERRRPSIRDCRLSGAGQRSTIRSEIMLGDGADPKEKSFSRDRPVLSAKSLVKRFRRRRRRRRRHDRRRLAAKSSG